MPGIKRNQKRDLFLLGETAQEVGDYFVLIRRYDEAAAEYQDAMTAYDLLSETSPDFANARKNKTAVQKNLNELQAGKVPVIEAEDAVSDGADKSHLEIIRDGVKYLTEWLSPIWQPPLAGLAPSAADISEKHHTFDKDDGDISISCQWRGQSEDDPAYILVKWKANIVGNKELVIRFVNPDTQEIRSEFRMGTIFVGEESFTKAELGFDPLCENWGIAVALVSVT